MELRAFGWRKDTPAYEYDDGELQSTAAEPPHIHNEIIESKLNSAEEIAAAMELEPGNTFELPLDDIEIDPDITPIDWDVELRMRVRERNLMVAGKIGETATTALLQVCNQNETTAIAAD